jgi:hypothetical protein
MALPTKALDLRKTPIVNRYARVSKNTTSRLTRKFAIHAHSKIEGFHGTVHMDMPHLDLLHALDDLVRSRLLCQPSSPSAVIFDEIWIWDRVLSGQRERIVERIVGIGVFMFKRVV